MNWLEETKEGLRLHVRVTPRARADRLEGLHGDALKIRLCAPPVEGAANTALLRFLARQLDVAPSRLSLLRGATGRSKQVLITGLAADAVRQRLHPGGEDGRRTAKEHERSLRNVSAR